MTIISPGSPQRCSMVHDIPVSHELSKLGMTVASQELNGVGSHGGSEQRRKPRHVQVVTLQEKSIPHLPFWAPHFFCVP